MININKPWGIVLNVIMFAIAGVTSLFGVLGILTSQGIITDIFPLASFTADVSIFLFALAIIYLVLAIYLWNLDKNAWLIAVVLNMIGVVLGILSIVLTPAGVIVFALQLILLASLFHKDTITAVKPEIKYPGWELGILED